jgi:polysaccharide biosynthesis transport protein
MDFGYLLGILARRKWLILGTMLAAAAATFVFIGRKPERYKSSVLLSTGIVNYRGINSDNSDAFVQQFQIENAFSNLIEFAQSRSCIKLLTIQMLQHDLTADGNGAEKPFRQGSAGLSSFSAEEKNALLADLQKIKLDSVSDPSYTPQFDYLLDKVARAYGYDHDAIRRSLEVRRKGETDYLTIDLTTETPALSKYLANAYATRFVTFYHNLAVREKRKNVESYTKLAAEKKWVVDSISDVKFEYLKQKGLPVLGKQSEELVGQITKLEIERQRAESRKKSAAESVQRIDKYIADRGSRDAKEVQSRILEKNSTAEQMERVRDLSQRSLEAGGKDADVEAELAAAKSELESTVRSSARTQGKLRTDESKRTREDLYKEKVSNDLDRIDAEESYSRLNNEIWSLKSKLGSMVVNDEVSTRLQVDQDRATEEFDKVNEELIKAKLALENAENPLSIVENAQLPEWPEPNRQVLISAFAAIAVGTLTIIALFVLAYMDSSLQSPDLFKKYTEGLPMLGSVAAVPVKGFDLQRIFSANGEMPQYTAFRENLRKIRGQLLASKDRIFLIVSTKPKEGKTFTMLSLAHSLAFNNKRVLLLDTNFKTPLPESFTDQATPNRTLLNQLLRDHGLAEVFQLKSKNAEASDEASVDILGNTGLHKSPSELLEPAQFSAFLAGLREHYDFIFMESAALNQYSDARELAPFADKIIAVFNATSVIRAADKESLEYLRGLGDQFAGSVLTEVDARNAH